MPLPFSNPTRSLPCLSLAARFSEATWRLKASARCGILSVSRRFGRGRAMAHGHAWLAFAECASKVCRGCICVLRMSGDIAKRCGSIK